MNDPPVVLIGVQGGNVSYAVSDHVNIRVIHINWDDVEKNSLGELCATYKKAWAAPGDLRQIILSQLIYIIQWRFPILATFQPQAWINDHAVDIDSPVQFDVTEKLLLKGPDYIDNLRDNDYPTDDLAEDLLDRRQHNGPFRVDVKEAAMKFLFAAENEAGARER